MTVSEMLRDMHAAHDARTAYREARDRLTEQARTAMLSGWEEWAEQLYAFADAADASYRAETRLSEWPDRA